MQVTLFVFTVIILTFAIVALILLIAMLAWDMQKSRD